MSVTASRTLVQAMSALYNLPVLVLHDFDVSGFTIFGTLSKSTRRFRYDKPPKVVDLALQLQADAPI
jgi:DNA topoisomerase VI subunit A